MTKRPTLLTAFIATAAILVMLAGCAAPPPAQQPPAQRQEDRGITVIQKMRTEAVS